MDLKLKIFDEFFEFVLIVFYIKKANIEIVINFFWAGSSDGRSSPWHGGGPGFKSRSVHIIF